MVSTYVLKQGSYHNQMNQSHICYDWGAFASDIEPLILEVYNKLKFLDKNGLNL